MKSNVENFSIYRTEINVSRILLYLYEISFISRKHWIKYAGGAELEIHWSILRDNFSFSAFLPRLKFDKVTQTNLQ